MNIPHGKFILKIDDNIIKLTLIGQFNQFGVIEYADAVKALVDSLQGQAFLMLVDNTQLEGATPAAYQASNEHNEWLAKQNVIAKATVFTSVVFKEVDALRVQAKQKFTSRSFATLAQAHDWLMSFQSNQHS